MSVSVLTIKAHSSILKNDISIKFIIKVYLTLLQDVNISNEHNHLFQNDSRKLNLVQHF